MGLLTSAPISQLAVQLLRRELVLAATVTRVPTAEYAGPSGGTVTLRVPVPRTARNQASPASAITYDAMEEYAVDVTMTHWYNGALIGDEDLSMTIQDFGVQILVPAVAAVAEAGENEVADVMNGAAAGSRHRVGRQPVRHVGQGHRARHPGEADHDKVPAGDRYVACAPDIVTRLLAIPNFVVAANRGDGGSALESATIGTVYGLTFVESSAIDAGSAVAYHKSGVAFGFGGSQGAGRWRGFVRGPGRWDRAPRCPGVRSGPPGHGLHPEHVHGCGRGQGVGRRLEAHVPHPAEQRELDRSQDRSAAHS